MNKVLWGLLVVSLTIACSSPFDAAESRLGTLLDVGEGLEIEVPDSAQVRQAFDIVARTTGNGCVSFGGTEVEVEGRVVDFRPFDLSPRDSNTVCTQVLKVFEHRASVQFDQPGPVDVRIHVMVRSADGALTETVIERVVEVR